MYPLEPPSRSIDAAEPFRIEPGVVSKTWLYFWDGGVLSAGRGADVQYAPDDEAPSTEATLGVEEEPAAARDGHEPAARRPRGRRKKTKS